MTPAEWVDSFDDEKTMSIRDRGDLRELFDACARKAYAQGKAEAVRAVYTYYEEMCAEAMKNVGAERARFLGAANIAAVTLDRIRTFVPAHATEASSHDVSSVTPAEATASEPLPVIGANQCEHGSLRRSCPTCELTAEVSRLTSDMNAMERRHAESVEAVRKRAEKAECALAQMTACRDQALEDRVPFAEAYAKGVERERDEASKQQRLAWERHAEKDKAYGEALRERDEARAMVRGHMIALKNATEGADAARAERDEARVQLEMSAKLFASTGSKVVQERDELAEALRFYADEDSYFAIGFLCDPPCGDFATDVEEGARKPGARARAALEKVTP